MKDLIRHDFKIAANVLVLRHNQILLARRYQTGYMDGHYSIIGGHLEPGESLRQAAMRELQEEVGLNVSEQNLTFVHLMHHLNDSPRLQVFFLLNLGADEPKIMEPESCDDLRWFDLQALPDNLVPYVREALQQHTINNTYSEYYL